MFDVLSYEMQFVFVLFKLTLLLLLIIFKIKMNKNVIFKRELNLFNTINKFVKQNTEKVKRENRLLKAVQDVLLHTKKIKDKNIYENQFPYILFGIVESTFIDEENQSSKNQKLHSTGLIIGNSTILVSNTFLNLIENKIKEKATFNPNVNLNEIKHELYDITFTPLNLSKEYLNLIPDKVSVIDYFCLENYNNDNKSERSNTTNEKRIFNSWSILNLDQPIGLIIKNIIKDKNLFKNSDYHYDHFLSFTPLENNEILLSNLMFPEIINKSFIESSSERTNKQSVNSSQEITDFSFFLNSYNTKFDEKFILLNNDLKEEINILPGFIICEYKHRFHLLGMNSNYTVSSLESEENKLIEDNNNSFYKIGLRLTKNKALKVLKVKDEFESKNITESGNFEIFNDKIFKLLTDKIKTKKHLCLLLKDNCNSLIEFLNDIKFNNNTNNKSIKKVNFTNHLTIDDPVLLYCMNLLWNKINFEELDKDTIDLNSLNISLNGSLIIREILKYKRKLSILNLTNCSLYSEGIKNIINPIFNTKRIEFLGRNLHHIDLTGNKINDKGCKYLKHLIKNCPELSNLSLKNNYISAKGLNYLLNSLKNKNKIKSLDLSCNMLSSDSGIYLEHILMHLTNLHYLNLECNTLGNEALENIIKSLKKTKKNKLEKINFAQNNITNLSKIFYLISLCNNINCLILNGNPLIFNNNFNGKDNKALKRQLSNSPLVELKMNSFNLSNNTNIDNKVDFDSFFSCLNCLENLQMLSLSNNNINDESCETISKYLLNKKNVLHYLNLSNNNITDKGIITISLPLQLLPNLKEINLSSNQISEEGGELIVKSVLSNQAIEKCSIENNNLNWLPGIEFKKYRKNIIILY